MAVKSHKTGIPSMRAMIMEFNDDPATKYLDMQYMLGDSILVAPIFNKKVMQNIICRQENGLIF